MEDQRIHESFEISAILRKHIQQQPLHAQEQNKLDEWLAASEHNRELFASLTDEESLAAVMMEMYGSENDMHWGDVRQRLDRVRRRERIRYWLPVAAVLAVIMSIGIAVYVYQQPEVQQLTSKYGDDVLPGANRAVISLSSGETISLDEAQAGIVTNADGLSYEDGSAVGAIAAAQYATLSTPRAGQYKVTLADGTVAWLNASSSLEYPVHFTGDQRRVRLVGEAFFEVSHDVSRPFVVETGQQQVHVLGTAFNVRAYTDTEATTLVSGKVAISRSDDSNREYLMPGQQATVQQGQISIRETDIREFTAWKEGLIMGRSIGFREIAAEIERWYDVDFSYPSGFDNHERAYVSLYREEKLSSVLEVLEAAYAVTFQVKGRTVYIN